MAHPGDVLTVRNKGSKPIVLQWDGRKTVIKPQSTGLASFEQVVNLFGHPAAGAAEQKAQDEYGNIYMVPSREEEIKRVQTKNRIGSFYIGESDVPDAEVFDQDGERIWTVLEDPEGEHAAPVSQAQGFSTEDQVARLTRQLEMLKKQVSAQSVDLQVGVTPDSSLPDLDVPTDDN